jgi:hypothetical protein
MDEIVKYAIASFPPALLCIILVLLFPEKVEKWAAMFWYALSIFGNLFNFAHKKAVKLDLQGCLNDFVKQISKEIPQMANHKVEIEFVEKDVTRRSFLSDDKVILRLRRDDPRDLNFVHGSYLFVSTSLLFRVKRYISKAQREALDLFVTTKLIEKEKPIIVDYYLEEYLHPKLRCTDSKRSAYYHKFSYIDRGGLFYTVLLEELDFLGGKVFGNRRDDEIVSEVDGLVSFLETVSHRKVGDEETDLDYKREYCRFAIMIIGKKSKLADSTKHYTEFIRNSLFKQEIEAVYVLGKWKNRSIIDDICDQISDCYWKYRTRKTRVSLNFDDGTSEEIDQYVTILRLVGTSVYQPG